MIVICNEYESEWANISHHQMINMLLCYTKLLGFAFSLNFSMLLLLLNQLAKKLYKSIRTDDMTINLRKLSIHNKLSVSNVITLWITDIIESEFNVAEEEEDDDDADIDAEEGDDES